MPSFVLLAAVVYTASLIFIIDRFIASRRRTKAPAESPSLLRKASSRATEKHDYRTSFPPVYQSFFSGLTEGGNDIQCVDLTTAPKRLLHLDADYRQVDYHTYFNFTGFSVADIKALGDFPDYAKLSGVPLPGPLLDFDIDKALPRPYRPFRWPYHQTMSLSKMDIDFWIELESTYRARIAQRQRLFSENGRHVLESLPGSELACKELMEMVLLFLGSRYPKQFSLDIDADGGRVLVNNILNTRTDLARTPPLEVLLHHVPEDFGIMLRDPATGRYVLRGGVICSSVGWKLSEKMGLGLPGIHKVVPDYTEKLEFSMDRFFTRMPVDKPIQRGSWGLEVGEPLYIPADHPDFAHRSIQKPDLRPEDVYLRVDWQTLRRLPLSGAIVFNFKALFTPMTEFKTEPHIPSLVLKVLQGGKNSLLEYKGTWHIEHIAKPALREYEKFQVDSGLIQRDWDIQTLPEAPFFRGWEKKWPVC